MLVTNLDKLAPEIMDVIRLYNADDENFTHVFSFENGVFINVIRYENDTYISKNSGIWRNELEFKRLRKRFVKLAFYNVLKNVKGYLLPWGALTGIRPTKLAYQQIESGGSVEKLFKQLDVSEENISLVESVIATQKPAYVSGGQDLYISLPFCPTKCEYCSFVTAPIDSLRKYVDEYVSCLVKEIEAAKPYLNDIRSIYVGGGTPFTLSVEQLTPIYAAIKPLLGENTEYTVEAGRPDTFTFEHLELCRKFNVNRICVNPQSFSDKTLQAIGRRHTARQTFKAFEMAKQFNFDINLDLICALTGETLQDFENSLNCALSLNPENITVHTLSLKSGAKLKESVKRLSGDIAGDMVKLSRKVLSENGYFPYYLYRQKYQAGGNENVGWCKKGKVCRYNVGVMEEISDNVALGAGAVSKRVFGGENRIERYASPKDIPTYIAKIDKIIEERKNFFSR